MTLTNTHTNTHEDFTNELMKDRKNYHFKRNSQSYMTTMSKKSLPYQLTPGFIRQGTKSTINESPLLKQAQIK